MSTLQKFHRRTLITEPAPVPWSYTISTRIGPQSLNEDAFQTTINDAWLTAAGCPANVSSITITSNVDIVGGLIFAPLNGGRSTAPIQFTNNGYISGRGGGYGTSIGYNGGPAIEAQRAVTFVNNRVVGGGGGGGSGSRGGTGWGGGKGKYGSQGRGAGYFGSTLVGPGSDGSYGGVTNAGGAVMGGGGGRGNPGSAIGGSNGGQGSGGQGRYSNGGGGSAGAAGGYGYYNNQFQSGGNPGLAIKGYAYVNNGQGLAGTVYGGVQY